MQNLNPEDQFIFTAADVVNQQVSRGVVPRIPPPHGVILCYQSSLIAQVVQNHQVTKVNGFFGDLYLLNQTRGQVAVAGNFGIGAPVAVALMEELVAFGARRIISIGVAGGLRAGSRAGDLVVCDRAIRDEGTSQHYLPAEKFACANATIVQALSRALHAQSHRFVVGASWTTDAPFRETRREVEQYQQEGIVTVEMEAAALFAAGQALGVQVGAAFAISDSLDGLRWKIDFDRERARQGVRTLFAAALQVLGEGQ